MAFPIRRNWLQMVAQQCHRGPTVFISFLNYVSGCFPPKAGCSLHCKMAASSVQNAFLVQALGRANISSGNNSEAHTFLPRGPGRCFPASDWVPSPDCTSKATTLFIGGKSRIPPQSIFHSKEQGRTILKGSEGTLNLKEGGTYAV
jgi:hypothetical protein